VIDCNEWNPEKGHECTNMGKVKRLELHMMATVRIPNWEEYVK